MANNTFEHRLKSSNFYKRTKSGLILLPFVLLLIYSGGFLFNLILLILAGLTFYEFYKMTLNKQLPLVSSFLLPIFITLYSVLPFYSIYKLRLEEHGLMLVLWLFLIVASTDIFCYLSGILLQGPKIAKKISPGKTISGAVFGLIIASCIGILYQVLFIRECFEFSYFIVPFLSVLSQIGDLIESGIKRYFKVKDSGSIIPGHGGIMDRTDGFLFVMPIFYFYVF